jgi:hypothetical protein
MIGELLSDPIGVNRGTEQTALVSPLQGAERRGQAAADFVGR